MIELDLPPPRARAEGLFVCPLCRAALAEGTRGDLTVLRCEGAHRELAFPLLDGVVPLLIDQPLPLLARAAIGVRESLRANGDWLQELDRRVAAEPESATGKRLERLRAGERHNRLLLEEVFAMLRQGLTADDVFDGAVTPADQSGYGDFNTVLSYVRRDFGGRPESEREIAILEAALVTLLEEQGYQRGSALVLGAGAGRIAWGLRAHFPSVLAMDSSPMMGALYRLLSRGPRRFFELNLINARAPDDQCVAVDARLPAAPPGSQLTYAVADVTSLPLADASQAVVVSVYFSDVVPPSRLLPEVARVLAPGGLFLHLGPMGWHFADIAEQTSADEFAQRVAGFGFSVGKPRVVRNTFLASSYSIHRVEFDNVCFAAVRLDD